MKGRGWETAGKHQTALAQATSLRAGVGGGHSEGLGAENGKHSAKIAPVLDGGDQRVRGLRVRSSVSRQKETS